MLYNNDVGIVTFQENIKNQRFTSMCNRHFLLFCKSLILRFIILESSDS